MPSRNRESNDKTKIPVGLAFDFAKPTGQYLYSFHTFDRKQMVFYNKR